MKMLHLFSEVEASVIGFPSPRRRLRRSSSMDLEVLAQSELAIEADRSPRIQQHPITFPPLFFLPPKYPWHQYRI